MKISETNNLFTKLKQYSKTDNYPFHMPGHKRNIEMLGVSLPFDIDITEIYDFDDLHAPEGILRNVSEKAEKVFHSEHSYMLINGSTCGILAAIYCTTNIGDKIIISRNCHKSVYNACELHNLDITYIFPMQDKPSGISGSITPESVERAIEQCPGAKAVIITSPTYEGVISDIESISQTAHKYSIPLIVDNAHGAHLPFCSFRMGDPVSGGADIVVSSLHKTLPSLTQTALAHVNGRLVSPEKYSAALGIFETSSPSYVLMSSIDNCLDFLINSGHAFEEYEKKLLSFSDKIKNLDRLTVLCHGSDIISNHNFYAFDLGKLVICTNGTNTNGSQLMSILREKYHLEFEMSYPYYTTAMTSICDTDEGFDRLAAALIEIDKTLVKTDSTSPLPAIPQPEKSGISLRDAKSIPNGKNISNKYIYAYPPGIPIIVPGEIITKDIIDYIKYMKDCGIKILGK